MKGKILCFGELLLRISPTADGSWLKKASLPVYVGGAEANVAAALAGWNIPVKYCSAIPDHYVSRAILEYLNEKNIDTSAVMLGGERLGLYYLQQGTDLKNTSVIYDREHSSFSKLEKGMIDWDSVLREVKWFHFSAITPALSANLAGVCLEALQETSRRSIPVSLDLNYRSRLWQYGKHPVEIIPELLPYCQLVMGNIWSSHTMLGTRLYPELIQTGTRAAFLEHAALSAQEIREHFPDCSTIAFTFRFDEGTQGIRYYATLQAENNFYQSPEWVTEKIVDKVGSGDCFMAGLLYGWHHQLPHQTMLDYATAAAFGKFQEKSDATSQTESHIQSIIHLS